MSEREYHPSKFRQWANEHGFIILSVLTTLFILVPLAESAFVRLLTLIIYTLLVAVSLLIISGSARLKWHHFVLMGLLIFPWLGAQGTVYNALTDAILGIFFFYVAIRIILIILSHKEVDHDVVVGSVAGYILLGIGFNFICALLFQFDQTAYNLDASSLDPYTFVYYTFVTMSTLGYGDITPATRQAEALSLLITISGQFYMVLVVATLVGKYAGRPVNSQPQD